MARYGRGQPQPPILLQGPIPETPTAEDRPPAPVIVLAVRALAWHAVGTVVALHGPQPAEAAVEVPPKPVIVHAASPPRWVQPPVAIHGPADDVVPRPVIVLAEWPKPWNAPALIQHGPIPEPVTEELPRPPTIVLAPSPYPQIQPAFIQHGPAPFSAGPSVVARWFAYRRATWKALPRITWQAQRRVVWRWQPQMVQTLSGFKQLRQATWESKDYTYDLSGYLPTSVSVSSATATLISPAGVSQSVTPTLSNNDQAVQAVVTCRVTVAMLAGATGLWKLDVKPTLSNGEIADGARFEIEVDF